MLKDNGKLSFTHWGKCCQPVILYPAKVLIKCEIKKQNRQPRGKTWSDKQRLSTHPFIGEFPRIYSHKLRRESKKEEDMRARRWQIHMRKETKPERQLWFILGGVIHPDQSKQVQGVSGLPTSTGSLKKLENSRKTSTSALLITTKPLTV